MRALHRGPGLRRGLPVVVLILAATPALIALESGFGSGSYTGEVVVRSLGGHRVVVALDETGAGVASRLFYVETLAPVEPLSLRAAGARVENSESGLVVILESEHRGLRFDLSPGKGRPDLRRQASVETEESEAAAEEAKGEARFEMNRVEQVASLAEYPGGPAGPALDAIEAGDMEGPLPFQKSAGTSGQPFQLPPDLGDGGDGACPKSCTAVCDGAVACSLTCASGCSICSCFSPCRCSP